MEDLVEPLNARTYACIEHPITIVTPDHRPLSHSEEVGEGLRRLRIWFWGLLPLLAYWS